MNPTVAQVLSTVVHEIRTPLAVTQGYLKLYAEGRLTADDTERALRQTRDALRVIATLCADMSRVGTLSESPDPPLTEYVAAADLLSRVQAAGEIEGAAWQGDMAAPDSVATADAHDLVQALAILARAAFDDARDEPWVIQIEAAGPTSLHLRAGGADAVTALPSGPDESDARPFTLARGGRGVTLIWASYVLQQHRVRSWQHLAHRASVGFRIPLVQT